MSSLKGILRAGKPNGADLTRTLQATLNGISLATLEGDDDELASFRASMSALASRVHESSSLPEIESAATSGLSLLEDYNRRAHQDNGLRATELKTVLRTMTETITFLSESRTRSVNQLQFMERELEQTTHIDDIRLLRTRIMKCLDVVRDETVRLQSEAESRSKEVRERMDHAAKIIEPPPPTRFGSMDAVTGLPSRRPAELAMTDALASGGERAISVFVVARLSSINAKYGRAVGDEVMLHVANHFATHLSASTTLYRWSGPALVALSDAAGNADEIKRSWIKAAGLKQEINLRFKDKSIFLLAETSILFKLVNKSVPVEDLFFSLDKFVADQSAEPPQLNA